MTLMQLIEYSKELRKKVPTNSGWSRMEPEYCREVLTKMGFERIDMDPCDVVVRALQLVVGLDKGIESEDVKKRALLMGARNSRVHNKDSFSDRYKVVVPGVMDVTIIGTGKGSRAGFEVFSGVNNFCFAVLQTNSAKVVGDYLDSLAA